VGEMPARPAPQRHPAPPAQRPAARPATDPRLAARGDNGLFAAEPATPPAPVAPRKSLFGIVTGAIRGSHAGMPAAPQPVAAAEPAPPEARGEPVRANVRQTVGEDMHIDIPAFLRRQSS